MIKDVRLKCLWSKYISTTISTVSWLDISIDRYRIWLLARKIIQKNLKQLSGLKIDRSQRAEAKLNKISNNINKTYTGLISVLQGFQKCIA